MKRRSKSMLRQKHTEVVKSIPIKMHAAGYYLYVCKNFVKLGGTARENST